MCIVVLHLSVFRRIIITHNSHGIIITVYLRIQIYVLVRPRVVAVYSQPEGVYFLVLYRTHLAKIKLCAEEEEPI